MKLGTFQSAREIALEHEVAELRLQLAQMKAYGRTAPMSEFVHEEREISKNLPQHLHLPRLATFVAEYSKDRSAIGSPLGYRILVNARDPQQPRNFAIGLYVSDEQIYQAEDIIVLCSLLFEKGMMQIVKALMKEKEHSNAKAD